MLHKVSCTRLSVKIAVISYRNDFTLIPLGKCVSYRRATKICKKFTFWKFWECPIFDIREYAFNFASTCRVNCLAQWFVHHVMHAIHDRMHCLSAHLWATSFHTLIKMWTVCYYLIRYLHLFALNLWNYEDFHSCLRGYYTPNLRLGQKKKNSVSASLRSKP